MIQSDRPHSPLDFDELSRVVPSRKRWKLAFGSLLLAASIGAGVGDVMYVSRISVPIRSGKFAFNKLVGTAVQGDSLKVTAVEGQWLKVKYAPKSDDPSKSIAPIEGYVMEDALSAREVAAATLKQTGSATEVASAGAGRGLLDSGKYALAKGLSPDPFYKMVTDSRAAMTDATFDEFTKTAKIGTYKPSPNPLTLAR